MFVYVLDFVAGYIACRSWIWAYRVVKSLNKEHQLCDVVTTFRELSRTEAPQDHEGASTASHLPNPADASRHGLQNSAKTGLGVVIDIRKQIGYSCNLLLAGSLLLQKCSCRCNTSVECRTWQ